MVNLSYKGMNSLNVSKIIAKLAFLFIAGYILFGYYQDMLFTAHLRTPFMQGSLFFMELAREPFGVMRWLGCWLTQFCYIPGLAILLYLTIWCVSFFVTEKALRLPDSLSALAMLPLGCLLLGVTDLGYWIYSLKDLGYWFSHSLAYLVSLLVLYVVRVSMKRCNRRTFLTFLFFSFAFIVLFPLLGWYIILMSLCLFLLEIKAFRWKAFILLLPLLSPLVWQNILYQGISTETLWLGGFPIFSEAGRYIFRPSIPFFFLAFFMLMLAALSAFWKKETTKKIFPYITVGVVSVLTFIFVWQTMFKDYNYLAEMRMTRYAMEDDWDGVLKEAQKAKRPSRSMVLLKNIALMNYGQLGNLSFRFSNNGREVTNPDNIQIGAMQIVAPTVYFNYGKITYSIRWAIENAVCYGYSPYLLMSLIRAAEYKGESAVVEKYKTLLHGHLFYKNWTPRPTSRLVESLEQTYANVIDSDNNNIERYLIETFAHSYETENDFVRELCLFNSMLYGDPALFWKAFVGYASVNPEQLLPQHYQEAYCLFMEAAPAELPFKVTISNDAVQGYQSFRRQYEALHQGGYDKKDIGEALREKWGGSYWWHYFFGRNSY